MGMSDNKSSKLSREERLAANLRANLRRRKAVTRKKASGANSDGSKLNKVPKP